MSLKAGIIAVQGNVSEHARAIERAGSAHDETVTVVEIRNAGKIPECDVLVLPGGESTTISRLIHQEGIAPEIITHVEKGKPLLATCAGVIVAAQAVQDARVENLGLIDVGVDRNAFGRQKDSFETELDIRGLDAPFPAVFIRAPIVTGVGNAVEVLATFDGHTVAVRDPPVTGTVFHPELTSASQIHELAFFDAVTE